MPKPADAPTSASNIVITEPSDLDHIRTVKADGGVSDLTFESHKPTPIEPQFIEDFQQAIAQPHGDGQALPADIALEDIPERIGYLKDVCGLDFGIGTSSIVQWVFEHIHIWGGLSWTASAILLGVLLRSAIFPLMVRAQRMTARLKHLNPYLKPLREQHAEAQANGDVKKMGQLAQEIRNLAKDAQYSPISMLAPILVQIPFGFGAWRVLRNAADTPVPGFVTEQWLWLHDLTFGDPYYLIPVVAAAFTYATLRVGRQNSQAMATAQMQMIQKRYLEPAIPLVTFAFVCFQPGAVQVYFMASTATGFITSALLNISITRKLLGIPAHETSEAESQPRVYVAPSQNKPRRESTSQAKSEPEPGRKPFITMGRSRVIDATARDVTDPADKRARGS